MGDATATGPVAPVGEAASRSAFVTRYIDSRRGCGGARSCDASVCPVRVDTQPHSAFRIPGLTGLVSFARDPT